MGTRDRKASAVAPWANALAPLSRGYDRRSFLAGGLAILGTTLLPTSQWLVVSSTTGIPNAGPAGLDFASAMEAARAIRIQNVVRCPV